VCQVWPNLGRFCGVKVADLLIFASHHFLPPQRADLSRIGPALGRMSLV
jgi:hypothetical protein